MFREFARVQESVSDLRSDFDRAHAALQDEIASCTSGDEVVTMLEGRVAELKIYVAGLSKTIPRPARIEASRKWLGARKILKLVFVCPVTAMELVVESKSWSLW